MIENMTLPDYALCCIPQVWEIFGNKSKILELNYGVGRGILIENNCTSLFDDGVFLFRFLLHQAISEKGAECVFPGLLYI